MMSINVLMANKLANRVKKAIFLLAFLLLAGCGAALGLGGDDTPNLIYDLVLPGPFDGSEGGTEKILFFEPMTYPAFIDTEKIAIKPARHEIRYLSDARWQDNGPDLISRYFVVSFENLQDLTVIDQQDTARTHQYRLNIDVRDFSAHIEADGMPVAHVVIVADLMSMRPLNVMAKQSFSRQVRAGANSKDAIVSAFNEAMEGVTSDLTNWIETTTK